MHESQGRSRQPEPRQAAAQSAFSAGLLAYACMLGLAVYLMTVENSYAPMRPEMAADLGLSQVQSAFISSAFLIGFALMQLPAGALLDRLGPARLVAPMALVTGLSCLILASSQGVVGLTAGRLLMGAAASFVCPAIASVTRMGLPLALFAMLMGISEMSIGVGGVAGVWGGNELQAATHWRVVMWIAAAASVPVAALCWWLVPARLFGPAAPVEADGHDFLSTLKQLLADRNVRLASLIYAGGCGTLCGFGGMWNIELAKAWRYHESQAILVGSAFFVGIAIGSPLVGWLANRFGSRATLLAALWLALPAFVFWIAVPADLPMWFDALNVALIGAALSSSALAFDIAGHGLAPQRVASAVAVVSLSGVAAGAVLEILPGLIAHKISGLPLHELQWANSVFPLMVLVTLWAVSRVGGKD